MGCNLHYNLQTKTFIRIFILFVNCWLFFQSRLDVANVHSRPCPDIRPG
jgi:hypothetical protein